MSTPLKPHVLEYELAGYDSNSTKYLVSGFRKGFKLGLTTGNVQIALLTVLVQSSWGCDPLQNLHVCLYGQGLVAHLRCRLKAKHNFWPRKRFD
jgi:hypothetical protein